MGGVGGGQAYLQVVAGPGGGEVLRRGCREGQVVAEIVNPLGATTPVLAVTNGVLFARLEQRFAWEGRIIGKIAGADPLASRVGTTLLPA